MSGLFGGGKTPQVQQAPPAPTADTAALQALNKKKPTSGRPDTILTSTDDGDTEVKKKTLLGD